MVKRKLIHLIILIAILGVAASTVVILLNLQDNSESDVRGLIIVAEIEPARVETMTIVRGESKVVLTKQEGKWYYAENRDAEVDQLITESTLTYISYVYATSIAGENVDDLSAYGLDPAQMSVSLQLDSGEIIRYSFGIATADKKGVFLQKESDPNLYVLGMESFEQIVLGIENINDLSLDINAKALTEFSLMRLGGERTALDFSAMYAAEEKIWMLESPIHAIANPKAVQLVEVIFSPPRLAGYVASSVRPKHGIGESSAYLSMTDEEGKSILITFGNQNEDGLYYCTVSGREGVYTVYSGMKELLKIDMIDAVLPSVFLQGKELIPDFQMTIGDKKYELIKEVSGYTLNGKPMLAEDVELLAVVIENMTIDGLMPEENEGQDIGKLVLTDKNDLEIVMTTYSKDYVALSMQGIPYAYIKAQRLALIIDELDHILSEN